MHTEFWIPKLALVSWSVTFELLLRHRMVADLLLDLRHDIPFPKARTLRLCTVLTAVTGF